jgi:membrane-bound ClpP family serine protease
MFRIFVPQLKINNMKYRISENKWISFTQSIAGIVFILAFLIGSIFTFSTGNFLGVGIILISLLISTILILICSALSTLKQRTSVYLIEITDRMNECKSIEEYVKLQREFYDEVIEDGIIRLPFPQSIKKILNELETIIKTLEKHK